jgi:hypothetical protein
MALTATQQILANNQRNLILKYTFGGTTGDLAAGVLVDASALGVDSDTLSLKSVCASFIGFSAHLLWDATTDVDLITIPDSQPFCQDFSDIGNIVNNSGAGSTGDVVITSSGYTAAGPDGGHLILHFKKS